MNKGIGGMGILFLVGFMVAVFSGAVVIPAGEIFQPWSHWKKWNLSDQIGFLSLIIGIFSLFVSIIGLRKNESSTNPSPQNLKGDRNIQIGSSGNTHIDQSTHIHQGPQYPKVSPPE